MINECWHAVWILPERQQVRASRARLQLARSTLAATLILWTSAQPSAATEKGSRLPCSTLRDSEQSLNLSIKNGELASQGRLWRLAPDKLTARDVVGRKPEVELREEKLTSVPETMSFPSFSISIYSFPVQ